MNIHLAVGVRKYIFFLFVANSTLISSLSVIFLCFANTKRTYSKRRQAIRIIYSVIFVRSREGIKAFLCVSSMSRFDPYFFSVFFCFSFKYFASRARWLAIFFATISFSFFFFFFLIPFFPFFLARFIEILD